MKRAILLLTLAALSLVPALPAAAQQQPGNVGIWYTVRTKMGSGSSFETALKQHVAWLKQQNETWAWRVWMKTAGPDLNEYVIVSPNHTLADFDAHAEFSKAMRVHWIDTVAQYTTSISGAMRFYREDISNPQPPGKTLNVAMAYTEQIRPGSMEEFNYIARKVNDAIKKSGWPAHYVWSQPISGSDGPEMIRVSLQENWAGFQPPSKDFRAMLVGVYGREEADSLLHRIGKVIVHESSTAWVFRPDLSYTPAK